MLIDDLAYGNRLRHAHPLEKATFALLCLSASLLARNPLVPGLVVLAMTAAALGCARIPGRAWAKLTALPVGFLLAGAVSLALEVGPTRGRVLRLSPGIGVGCSASSLRLALQVTARSLGCTMAMLFLAATTPLTDLIQLLRRARVPSLVLELLTLTYRALFLLLDTAGQMQRAQASRLGHATWRASLRSLALMVTRLFSRSLGRTELAWQAMLTRGYVDDWRVLPRDCRLVPARVLGGAGLGLALLALALFLPKGW